MIPVQHVSFVGHGRNEEELAIDNFTSLRTEAFNSTVDKYIITGLCCPDSTMK